MSGSDPQHLPEWLTDAIARETDINPRRPIYVGFLPDPPPRSATPVDPVSRYHGQHREEDYLPSGSRFANTDMAVWFSARAHVLSAVQRRRRGTERTF